MGQLFHCVLLQLDLRPVIGNEQKTDTTNQCNTNKSGYEIPLLLGGQRAQHVRFPLCARESPVLSLSEELRKIVGRPWVILGDQPHVGAIPFALLEKQVKSFAQLDGRLRKGAAHNLCLRYRPDDLDFAGPFFHGDKCVGHVQDSSLGLAVYYGRRQVIERSGKASHPCPRGFQIMEVRIKACILQYKHLMATEHAPYHLDVFFNAVAGSDRLDG